jgi:hypothetical protein
MEYQKRQNFAMSSNSTGKCSKLRPVLRFRVTQKAALIWNMTVFEEMPRDRALWCQKDDGIARLGPGFKIRVAE